MLDLGASGTVTMPTKGSSPGGSASTRPCHYLATNVWPKLREAGAGERAEQDADAAVPGLCEIIAI
jgi:hypothetical protein